MNSSTDVDRLINQCENYLMENDVMSLIKQCLHQLCLHQPDNPVEFLKQFLASEQVNVCEALIHRLENDR